MSTPLPLPHPECTAKKNPWVAEFENNPDYEECENRPWANEWNKQVTGCVGQDFVLHNPRVHMRFFWNEKEQLLAGVVHWGIDTEGPPKGSHGASVALVFDEILAYPVWRSGTSAFTANLNLNLRAMVPFNTTQRFEARVTERVGKKIYVQGYITSPYKNTTYADCKGLWIANPYLNNIHPDHPANKKKQQQQVAASKL